MELASKLSCWDLPANTVCIFRKIPSHQPAVTPKPLQDDTQSPGTSGKISDQEQGERMIYCIYILISGRKKK